MVTFRETEPQTLLAPAICAAPAPARSRPVAPLSGFGPPPPAARRPRGAQRVRARPRGAPCRPARRRRGGAWLRRAGPRGRTSSLRVSGRGAPSAGHTARAATKRALSGAVTGDEAGREGPRSAASPSGAAGKEAGGAAHRAMTCEAVIGVAEVLEDHPSGPRGLPPRTAGSGLGGSFPGSATDQLAGELRLSARSADGRGREAGRRRAGEARGEGAWSAGRGDARRRRRTEEARGDPGPRRPRPPRPPQSRPRRLAASLCASASGRLPPPPRAGPNSARPAGLTSPSFPAPQPGV